MTEQHECEWKIGAIKYNDELYANPYCVSCGENMQVVQAERRLNEYETLKEAFTIAIHLLGHGDFKNGNTGPNGLIDEGEVYACRLMDKIKELVPQLYADILEGNNENERR